jgi:nicotinamidase/pyrazinamidase
MEKPIMKALIVVDMLNDFIDPKGALYCGPMATEIVPNVYGRVKEYREAGLPIFFSADNHPENDKEFERFPKHCVAGTNGARVIGVLRGPAGQREWLITKTRYSSFYKTDLEAMMTLQEGLALGKAVIEVCGVCTSICVMDTIGGLANRDYATVVHRNCVADFDQEMHEMALRRMANLYGTVII